MFKNMNLIKMASGVKDSLSRFVSKWARGAEKFQKKNLFLEMTAMLSGIWISLQAIMGDTDSGGGFIERQQV